MARPWGRGRVGRTATALTLAVLLLAGIATSPIGAVGAIGVSILTSFAFAAPIVAYSVTQKSDQGFAFIFRLIITPLTFFSGDPLLIEALAQRIGLGACIAFRLFAGQPRILLARAGALEAST